MKALKLLALLVFIYSNIQETSNPDIIMIRMLLESSGLHPEDSGRYPEYFIDIEFIPDAIITDRQAVTLLLDTKIALAYVIRNKGTRNTVRPLPFFPRGMRRGGLSSDQRR